jgi:RHS repeat-associated protein
VKYNATTGEETLYFNKLWQMRNGEAEWVQSKHIYEGETRIGTKYNSEGNENTGAEQERIYYYHGDHLGSAQVVTNHAGQLYERLEYTPYGETWTEQKYGNGLAELPCRFTGKELDEETGLYYYGARYLDPKTSRWLSADPAMGDYLPSAPVNEEARRNNQNLPGMGGVYNYVNLHVYHYAGNNPVKYTDPDGKYLINNAAQGTQNAEAYASSISSSGIPTNTFGVFAHVFRRGMNVPIVVQPKMTQEQINIFPDKIELSGQLNSALDRAISAKQGNSENTKGEIEASVTEMENGRYKINISVSVDGRIIGAGTIAFAESNEVLNNRGDIDRNKVKNIADETINIVRNTTADTKNIDLVR